MKNALRIAALLTLVIVSTGVANAGIIIVNRNAVATVSEEKVCTEPDEKSLTGIIIVNFGRHTYHESHRYYYRKCNR